MTRGRLGAAAGLAVGAALALLTTAWSPAAASDATPQPAGAGASGLLERRIGDCILVAPPDAARALESLASHAESLLPSVSAELGVRPRAPYRMVLLLRGSRSHPTLRALDDLGPPWAAGFMDPGARVGVIRLEKSAQYPYGTPEAVLAHESAHQLLHDVPGLELPLWFEEGVATWVAREWQLEDLMRLSSRAMTRDLPRLESLNPMFHGSPAEVEEAYSNAFAFTAWCTRRYGASWAMNVIQHARTHSFERAFRLATGTPLDRAESAWRRESLFRYRWLPLLAAGSSVWLLVMLLSAWVLARKRARAKALEAAWEADEASRVEEDAPWDAEPESDPVGGGYTSGGGAEAPPTVPEGQERRSPP